MKKKTQEKEGNSRNTDEETTDTKENMEKMAADSIENATSEENQQDPESKGNQAEATSDKVMSEVRAIEEKLAEMQDKYLRLSAEFDNYRKRTLKEKMDLTKYAEEDVLSKIIPFMDDFDRAMQHIDTADGDAMKNGLNLIYAKFSDFLSQNGIKEIDALNTDFNVDLHDAVAKVPVEDESKKGKVVDVVLKGYYLKDRVLRHAKVVVGE
jgi:molecular chaperone GrpE